MARVYDIIGRLENGNQKPIIKLDAEHEYTVNNSKAAAFRIMAISQDEKIEDADRMAQIIKVALGKEAFDYIESLDKEITMKSYTIIINAIMAAISDVDIEEIEEEGKKARKAPRRK